MPVSGVLAVCRPEDLPAVRRALSDRAWSEVHYSRGDGRLVVTVEGDSTEVVMDRVQVIQRLPGVLFAEMAEHFLDDALPEETGTARATEAGGGE